MRDSHNKAMEDMAAAVEAKEQAHSQELIDLERKLLTDKGNLQKVMKDTDQLNPILHICVITKLSAVTKESIFKHS